MTEDDVNEAMQRLHNNMVANGRPSFEWCVAHAESWPLAWDRCSNAMTLLRVYALTRHDDAGFVRAVGICVERTGGLNNLGENSARRLASLYARLATGTWSTALSLIMGAVYDAANRTEEGGRSVAAIVHDVLRPPTIQQLTGGA